MSIRIGWIIKPVAVGIIVMLLICYMFSLAFSINTREYKMMNKLTEYGDTTFDHLRGSGDIAWLAVLGSLIALFAGGMAATLLSRSGKVSVSKWLVPSVIVAIITMLVIDGYMLVTWNDSVQKWHISSIDEYGRPFEPIVFPALLFLMLAIDAACLAASAAGGFAVGISRSSKC